MISTGYVSSIRAKVSDRRWNYEGVTGGMQAFTSQEVKWCRLRICVLIKEQDSAKGNSFLLWFSYFWRRISLNNICLNPNSCLLTDWWHWTEIDLALNGDAAAWFYSINSVQFFFCHDLSPVFGWMKGVHGGASNHPSELLPGYAAHGECAVCGLRSCQT